MQSTLFRRWLLAFAVVAVPLAVSPSSVRAEDEPPSPLVGDPEALGAKVNGHVMALQKEGLPEGWALLEGEAVGPDAKTFEDAVTAIAKDKGVATADEFEVVMTSVSCPEGAKVHYAYVDLGAPSQTFVDALKAEGATKGWAVRAMGTEKHLLVIAAPEAMRAKAEDVATSFAGRMLARRATSSVEANPPRAAGFARLALQLDPKSAGAHFVYGYVAMQHASKKQPQGDFEPAITHFKMAIDKAATNPLSKRDAAFLKGQLGLTLLLHKVAPSAEARDILKEAVASAADLDKSDARDAAVVRYNLACAHGRLKELDEAFKLLTAVLADEESGAAFQLIGGFREDADFTNLKDDPRWKQLLEKYPAAGGDEDK